MLLVLKNILEEEDAASAGLAGNETNEGFPQLFCLCVWNLGLKVLFDLKKWCGIYKEGRLKLSRAP